MGETPKPPPQASPASSRAGDPPGVRRLGPDDRTPPSSRSPFASGSDRATSGRGEEIAALYRKIADLQSQLSEAESRFTRAQSESAGADEMVGQMLARVGEVEAKLRDAEGARGEAEGRLAATEAHAAGLAAALEASRREAEEARAEAAAIGARLGREREQRETLALRVGDLSKVCDERDAALLREELLEAELTSTRVEMVDLRTAHTAELAAALAREEAAAARVIGADELAAVSAERDALVVEALHLHDAVAAVQRVLSDLGRTLGGHEGGSPPPRPAERTAALPPEPAAPRAEGPAPMDPEATVPSSSVAPGAALTSLVDDASEEDETTKVFGAREMALVRESARRSEPGSEPRDKRRRR
jgi:hypothetical protein